MKKSYLLGCGICVISVCSLLSAPLHAAGFGIAFSFESDPGNFVQDNDFIYTPGTVTGLLFGLSENGNNQVPTAIRITSGFTSPDIANNVFDTFNDSNGTFSLVNGNVVDADFIGSFGDTFSDNHAITFNWNGGGWNVLWWQGGSGPVPAMGNTSGFSGVAYSVGPVPIPSAVWLFSSGLIGLVGLARRKANA